MKKSKEVPVLSTHREAPPDVDIKPKFVIVYVAKEPLAVYRIGRTHARSFETMDDLLKFAHDNEIGEADLIGAWKLGKPLALVAETKTVTHKTHVSQWGVA